MRMMQRIITLMKPENEGMRFAKAMTMLAMLLFVSMGTWAQEPETTTYSVKMKAGTKDAKNWTIASGEKSAKGSDADGLTGLKTGDAVTLTYSGRLKVKGVTVIPDWTGDLSNIPASLLEDDGKTIIVSNGMTLTGTLHENYRIEIANDAEVTLDDVSIINLGIGCNWAGINCPGNATLILKEGSENIVCAGRDDERNSNYPGIWIAPNKTLTIKGDGQLTAYSNDELFPNSAGIGGGFQIGCGNINILGGTIKAIGGSGAAGIGGGSYSACGTITLSGGVITATGGWRGPGIGGGRDGGSCGDITISTDVTSVTATKGEEAPHSIGNGYDGTCSTVTIGGVVYWKNQTYMNDGVNYLTKTSIIYPETTCNLANILASDLEEDGQTFLVNDGMTLVGKLSAKYKIVLDDAATVTLAGVTINGTNDSNYNWAGITCKGSATIIMKDDSKNVVKGFYNGYPGIYVPEGATLAITGGTKGTGSLTASSNGDGAGIGGGESINCGNIIISGGTVNATGGSNSAGIGGGDGGSCGDITITDGVTSVTATKGDGAPYSIGKGKDGDTCGTVTIGDVVGAIEESPYTFPNN